MYLAPLNYDRFFQRIFSNPVIAKRFFEDFLNVVITFFEPLPRKNKLTDDAAFVEFDYRCRINNKFYILDMQQWYKKDVPKRFYLYFCNSTSLQLEKMTSVTVPMLDGSVYKTKDYDQLEPTITLVWMVDDTLGFEEDVVGYSMFPESMNSFMQNEELWATLSKEELLVYRQKLLKIANNKTKNLDFFTENRLVFMLQPNIVKHKILTTYFDWFEFAAKTKDKKNVAADFKKYSNDPIFSTMMEKLRTSKLSNSDFEYIDDYEEYLTGVRNYDAKIRREAIRDIEEERRIEREQARIEREREREQARIERERVLQQNKHTVRNMRFRGFSAEDISSITEIPMSEVLAFFEALDSEHK